MQILAETDWWTASAAWATAFAAIIYTGFTIWLAMETWKLRRAQTDPFVIVYGWRQADNTDSKAVLEMIIENVGAGIAFDVEMNIDSKNSPIVEKLAGSIDLLHSIRVLPPKHRLRRVIRLDFDKNNLETIETNIRIKWSRSFNSGKFEEIIVPFQLKHSSIGSIAPEPLDEIRYHLSQIQINTKALASRRPYVAEK